MGSAPSKSSHSKQDLKNALERVSGTRNSGRALSSSQFTHIAGDVTQVSSKTPRLSASSVPAAGNGPNSEPVLAAFSDSVVPLGHTAYVNENYRGAPMPEDEVERQRTLASLKVLVRPSIYTSDPVC
jgi:hypothetical protein